MLEDYIYTKQVHYIRKGKWRNCQLQIQIVKRCQDGLLAIITSENDKYLYQKLLVYGYECNNFVVGLIGKKNIHRIKFESLEAVTDLTELLVKYVKDVSFKYKLMSCSSSQDDLPVNDWYTLHVQTNRICFISDDGNRLMTKWNRADIGKFYIKDNSLHVEVVSNNEKNLYSFYREEKFPLEKTFKAIQNLKFEFPMQKQEKFISTPRCSVSIDLKKLSTWGSTKERIARERNSSSFRTCDSFSNDDSSSPSAPCSPTYLSMASDQIKDNDHLNEKEEEMDELIFPFDSMEVHSENNNNLYKANECLLTKDNPILLNGANSQKLVDLERFPYESERKSRGKRSPDHSSQIFHGQTAIRIYDQNIHDKFRNSSCYQTMSSIEHNRKTSSEANFMNVKTDIDHHVNTSRSADIARNVPCNLTVSPSDKTSQCSSPMILLSSSSTSCRTPASLKSKDRHSSNYDYYHPDTNNHIRLASRRTSLSDSKYNYYNLENIIENGDSSIPKRPLSTNDDSLRYNYCQTLSSGRNYYNMTSEDLPPDNVSSHIMSPALNYLELHFGNNKDHSHAVKLPRQQNYKEIDIQKTEALKEVDDNIVLNGHVTHKKKKPNILKYFKK